jgi:predicted membrane protein (TIGR00267 family)
VTAKRPLRQEHLFFIITGLVEGMLTALTLATAKMLHSSESISTGLAIRIALAAGLPTVVVLFAAEYARQRQTLQRMAHQLNMTRRNHLAEGKLGRQAWRESGFAALASGLCSFVGALMPLLLASALPGPGWPAVAVSLACLGGLGAGIGYATASCKNCWAWVLVIAGGALAWLGDVLQVV